MLNFLIVLIKKINSITKLGEKMQIKRDNEYYLKSINQNMKFLLQHNILNVKMR